MSFIFGGNTDLTYEDVQSRRKIAENMRLLNSASPKNTGEGVQAIARALVARGSDRQADKADTRLRGEFNDQFSSLIGGGITPAAYSSTSVQAGPPQGDISAFNASLARTESGGDLNVRNAEGYTGRYQFGQARLDDFNRENGTQYSTDDLRGNEPLTEAVQAWHVGDIDSFIDRNGLSQFEGQTVNGVPITRNGMRAMAHLGGNGGLQKFLTSGGQYNPADSNGTSLADYARTHGQVGTVSTQNTQGQGGNLDRVANLANLASNPYASPGQQAVIQSLMQRSMPQAPMSPMEQVQLQLAQAQLGQVQNPQPETTDDIREYEFAKSQGYEGGFSDYMLETRRAGASSNVVNNVAGEQAAIGSIPQGYVAVRDESQPSGYRMEAIPGGPADSSKQDQVAQDNKDRSGAVITEDIDRALSIISESPTFTTGLGAILKNVPGTQARSLDGLLTTIRANVGFDRLQQMRDASVTGGALGAINQTEMELLQAVLGNLQQSQNSDDLARNLSRVNDIYMDIIHGTGNRPEAPPPPPTQTAIPQGFASNPNAAKIAEQRGITVEQLWDMMPEEGRAGWN